MKHGGKMLVGLAGGLALGVAATTMAVTADNPYGAIVERNVFGLKPPPPPPDPEANKPPPPKILLQGITTFGGVKRALFKLTPPPKPSEKPTGEQSYVLTEGQRDGEVEVLEINPVAGTVKVRNFGTIEDLDFDKNGIKAPATAPPVTPGVRPPGVVPLPPTKTVTGIPAPAPGGLPPAFARTIRTGSATPYTPQGAAVGGAALNLGGGAQSSNPTAAQQAAVPQRSMEENLLILEANRLRHAEKIKAGTYPPLPRHPLMEAYKEQEAAAQAPQ